MGKTNPGTWKARERQAAALFGARRNRCSGSSGRADLSKSDSTHPRLFLEVKLRAHFPFRAQFDAVQRCDPWNQPAVALFNLDETETLRLLVVHSDNLDALLSPSPQAKLFAALRRPVALVNLFLGTEKLAGVEGKTAVVLVATKGRPGFLVAFRLDQMETIRRERYLARLAEEAGATPTPPGSGEAA